MATRSVASGPFTARKPEPPVDVVCAPPISNAYHSSCPWRPARSDVGLLVVNAVNAATAHVEPAGHQVNVLFSERCHSCSLQAIC
ncbi:hypothetical protein ACOMHN_031964 [Nucella lapillus]